MGPTDGIEQDLDTVDAALRALDAGDLDRAEALASELEALPAVDPAPQGEPGV